MTCPSWRGRQSPALLKVLKEKASFNMWGYCPNAGRRIICLGIKVRIQKSFHEWKKKEMEDKKMKYQVPFAAPIVISMFLLSACKGLPPDQTGPDIRDINTSGNVVVISDCLATSVTVTAKVTDDSRITNVRLWYRVGSDQAFTPIGMDSQGGLYTVSVKGSSLQGHGYGALEFYITAQDGADNSSQSPIDKSIQFLPCVSN
jgi:hypothetical protein